VKDTRGIDSAIVTADAPESVRSNGGLVARPWRSGVGRQQVAGAAHRVRTG